MYIYIYISKKQGRQARNLQEKRELEGVGVDRDGRVDELDLRLPARGNLKNASRESFY